MCLCTVFIILRRGISKVDVDTGRVYTGIVDSSRFGEQNLKNALYGTDDNGQNPDDTSDSDEDDLAMKIVKRNSDHSNENDVFLNRETYDKEIPLAMFKDKDYREIRYINYEPSDSRDRTTLETTVIMPNE